MSEIRIQHEDFDPGAEIAALDHGGGAVGAVASFIGLVRGDDGLVAMTLDHYPGMCEREIAAHLVAARERWPLLGVRIVHRVGRLTPGMRIVFVGVASSHRQAALRSGRIPDGLSQDPRAVLEDRRAGANGASWVEASSASDRRQRQALALIAPCFCASPSRRTASVKSCINCSVMRPGLKR